MNRPVDPDLDDNPRIPSSWTREDLAHELRKERRRGAEEITESRKLRAALKPFAALFDSDDEAYRDAKLTNATIPIRDVQAARAALKGESLP